MRVSRLPIFGVTLMCLVAVWAAPSQAWFPYVALFADTLGGPGGEEHSHCYVFAPAPLAIIEIWVWFWPDPTIGMNGCQFKIRYPFGSGITQGAITSNPLNQMEAGTLEDGISVSLGNNCQYDWYWTHRQELVVNTMLPMYIGVGGSPVTFVSTCEPDAPMASATWYWHSGVYVNQWCWDPCYQGGRISRLRGVAPMCNTILTASFEYPFDWCTSSPLKSHFVVREKWNPAESIGVVDARFVSTSITNVVLTLESLLVNDTTYVLEARSICNCYCNYLEIPFYTDSEKEFVFRPIATLLQSSSVALRGSEIEVSWELSSIDEGASFFVFRSENGGDFERLDGSAFSGDGRRFTYVDRSIEPGKSYSYKVEYGIGASIRVLFISESIATPAMPLILYQNNPNPFNPSTTLSFYLPHEAIVGLEVYDIVGRLVSRLISGERREAGTHNVEWDGRDSRGASMSSGIYFYRLTAGKETISKKMVLLR